jgi:amidophosphoribosyltransferase
MCGIAGYYINNPKSSRLEDFQRLDELADMLLYGIENRGTDATGIVSASVGSKHAYLEKADLTASEFVKWRHAIVRNPRLVLGHTRYATKGPQTNLLNNHPVKNGTAYITHNGHISNDDELFVEHGLTRNGQVDSEVIAALFDKFGIDKAHQALQVLDGNMAVAVCDPERFPDTVLLAKGRSSPCIVLDTGDLIVWASTQHAIVESMKEQFGANVKMKKWSFMKEGDIKIITPNKIEDLEFKVYRKPYVPTPHTSGVPQGGYGFGRNRNDRPGTEHWDGRRGEWSDQRSENHRDLCVCGEVKYWHGGATDSYTGPCIVAGSKCHKFVKESDGGQAEKDKLTETTVVWMNGERTIFVHCLFCEQRVQLADAEDVYGYWMCDECAGIGEKDDELKLAAPELKLLTTENKETSKDVLATVLMGNVTPLMGNKPEDSPDYDPILGIAAEEHEVSYWLAHWLLFDAEDEDFTRNPQLVNTYCLIQDEYDRLCKLEKDEETAVSEAQGELLPCVVPLVDCGVIAFEDLGEEGDTK